MHDGSVSTLQEVVDYYRVASHAAQINDPDFRALTLSPDDVADLVEFLKALTGDILNAEPPASFPQ